MRWAVGVTTVSTRRDTLLPRTLESLRNGGFEVNRLFVDYLETLLPTNPLSQEDWSSRFGCPVTLRIPAARPYLNWWLGLIELYGREPHADRYAMFQDDVVCSRNLRQYLEKSAGLYNYPGAGITYPDGSVVERAGYLNLFTFHRNEEVIRGKKIGWVDGVEMESGNVFHGKKQQKGLGAVALVFSREAVINLIGQPHMIGKPADSSRGHRAIDGAVVESMNRIGFREYIHNPSLVEHIGVESTIRRAPWPVGALSFHGEGFDCLDLLRGQK